MVRAWALAQLFLAADKLRKNLEPSEATLALIRIGGVVLLLALAILWLAILRNRPDPGTPPN